MVEAAHVKGLTPRMSRHDIYYWKCDRPAAFHGTEERTAPRDETAARLTDELRRHFHTASVDLEPAPGQGNHLTWIARVADSRMFLRVETGPEEDAHLAIESALLDHVRATGVPTPRVLGCDASRSRVPFAWQALEFMPHPDLNHWYKQGTLHTHRVACEIGAAIARWQSFAFPGFGPPDASLRGCHATYAEYYHLRLEEHLAFLVGRGFLQEAERAAILAEIARNHSFLALTAGYLVHKDLALWNILGSESHIAAFIDFDDAISGDPMDDLSLLGCFHDAAFVQRTFEGYQTLRPLPSDHLRRFWMHLLRNMIVKAVIRVGAGYFQRSDSFFLIPAGSTGQNLRAFTHSRLALALRGLQEELPLSCL